jgi:hypothetical protein
MTARWGAERSFLGGSVGVAQALVSACVTTAPRWDGLLLVNLHIGF